MSQHGTIPTPRLDALLGRLGRRLRAQVVLHGLGRTSLVLFVWLAFMFLADWTLHLPSGVRAIHLVVLVALPLFVLWRELFSRLARVPDRDGLAVLLERSHPELKELVVSAVQLGARAPRDGEDPELVARVVADAEARAGELDLGGAIDARRPRRAFSLGALALVLVVALLAFDREASGIFFARIAGGGTAWPQRTRLSVEIPVAGGRAQVETSDEEIHVRVARGSDVPVVVRAEGVVPDEVTLHFQSGMKSSLPSTGGATFRQLLRSVQDDLSFYVTGGDDDDRLPRVVVRVLQPPDVSGIALVSEPPAYTGLPARTVHDRDLRVLAGTRVRVHVLPDPLSAVGVARLLPADRVLELVRAPFPAREELESGTEAVETAEPVMGLAFELVADADLRYRFELEDETGLTNPDPGLFAIQVIEDRPPEVELLSPGRIESETVLGGELPLRVRALDDFGIAELELSVLSAGDADPQVRTSALAPRVVELPERDQEKLRAAVFATRRLTVAELAGDAAAVEGQLFELWVQARDVREPGPQEGRSLTLRVRVVSADEFLRRVQDRLSRARIDVSALGELLDERQRRSLELVAGLESDQPGVALDAGEIGTAISGQRRVQGDARALARELASVAEDVIYSRLDDRAGALVEELARRSSEITDRGFRPELWQALAAQEASAGGGGAAFANRLVQIVGLALEISESDAPAAIDQLRAAEAARDLTVAHEALLAAAELQAAANVKTDRLLELLAEWDNFQSVLSLTRELLNRQKNLLERTRQYAKEN